MANDCGNDSHHVDRDRYPYGGTNGNVAALITARPGSHNEPPQLKLSTAAYFVYRQARLKSRHSQLQPAASSKLILSVKACFSFFWFHFLGFIELKRAKKESIASL